MKEKKGISLIVLVITILVIIVLAGAVILTVAKDNPLDKASQANVLSDRSNIQYAIQLYISAKMSSTNTDTTKIMETLWAGTPTAGQPNPIDFAKLDMVAPKLNDTTNQKWVLDATTGKVFIRYDKLQIAGVPTWAKAAGGATILPEFADLFQPTV